MFVTFRGSFSSIWSTSILSRRTKASKADPVGAVFVNPKGPEFFATAKTGPFVQDRPRHENPYLADTFLQRFLANRIPDDALNEVIQPDLSRFGERVASEVWTLGRQCEENPPRLIQTDPWGHRVDEIVTCEAWKKLKDISAEEGLIAIGYERRVNEFSRLYQSAKLSLFAPASGLFSCPLAMTDGAAKIFEELNSTQFKDSYDRLTSRDPKRFWTSGQWMTEKGGGSDVGTGTQTYAIKSPEDSDTYRLYGYKWFSSATDSNMAITLARIVNESGYAQEGSKGLSMFYLETRMKNDSKKLNGIQVQKLKNKLGTRQLPTGELLLDGTEAKLISPQGRGVPSIANMLLITRIHNAISSFSYMRKITHLARDYAQRRRTFGKLLKDHVLHAKTLAHMETETRGSIALTLDIAHKLGLQECFKISDRDKMILRVIVPLAKLYTAKESVSVTSEGLECFGGLGYIEDTGIPGMLRDAQVTPIWEGTTNILSLDVLRAIAKSNGEVLKALCSKIMEVVKIGNASSSSILQASASALEESTIKTLDFVSSNPQLLENAARDLAMSLSNIYIGCLLLEHAQITQDKSDEFCVQLWLNRDLSPLVTKHKHNIFSHSDQAWQDFVFQGYNHEHTFDV